MPRRGQVTSSIRPEVTTEEGQLAEAMRAMCECVVEHLGSQKAIAEKMGINPTALSEYLSATRFPSEPTLSSLWSLMPDGTSRAELALLHAKADAARRLRRSLARAQAGDAAEVMSVHTRPRPAPLIIRNRCQKRFLRNPAVSAAAAARAANAPERQVVLPVPPAEGDRQHPPAPEPTWTGLEEVRQHLKAGRESAAMTILSNAAHAADAIAVRNVVTACRNAGLDEAAHAVLTNASHRAPEIVLGIVGSLHEAKNFEDAAFLTRSATQRASSRP